MISADTPVSSAERATGTSTLKARTERASSTLLPRKLYAIPMGLPRFSVVVVVALNLTNYQGTRY